MLCKLVLLSVAVGAVVPTVPLNNGVMMPVIALGTAGYDNATVADAITKAFAAGINHIHSAYDYFNVQGVGQGLKSAKSRDDFFLTAMTTPCQHPAAPPIRYFSSTAVITAATAAITTAAPTTVTTSSLTPLQSLSPAQ
jgi:hypothetical protein